MLAVAIILGTRPEAVKLCPVIRALTAKPDHYRVTTIATGQHRGLFDQVAAALGVAPNYSLKAHKSNQTLGSLSAVLLDKLDDTLNRIKPDLVIVQGDTQSALTGALAATFRQIAVAHVEAGLRSGVAASPFPEEVNRRLIARTASLHFAPTLGAYNNLLEEGVEAEDIAITGNTVIDSLGHYAFGVRAPIADAAPRNRRQLLVTCHRRENWDSGIDAICFALLHIIRTHRDVDVLFILPVAPQIRAKIIGRLRHEERITLSEPLPYPDFLAKLVGTDLVMTDSGGLQEEAPALGIPTVVMREETDRPEVLDRERTILAGTSARGLIAAANHLLTKRKRLRGTAPQSPLGDGRAADRIALAIDRWAKGKRPLLAPHELFAG